MNEQRLWAPWRLSYITGDSPPAPPPEPIQWLEGADRSCFVCRAAATFADAAAVRRELLIVARGEQTIALLNRFPYNNGHMLVCPERHVAELEDLSDAEHVEIMAMLTRFTKLYAEILHAEGFNIGLNLGRAAGAGVPGHLHWHLVPRWSGDNNFMSVTADARVIPQALDELWLAIDQATRHET